MRSKQIGPLPVDRDKLQRLFLDMRRRTQAAINDFSTAKDLDVAPYESAKRAFQRSGIGTQISNIGEIFSSPK